MADEAGAAIAEGVKRLVPETWCSDGSRRLSAELECGEAEFWQAVAHMAVAQHEVTVQRVVRYESALQYGLFLLRVQETRRLAGAATVRTLLHDTAAANVPSILGGNLDWRRSRRVKYGKGVSFSTSADYAMRYSSPANGSARAMLVTDVVVGRAMHTDQSIAFPPEGIDTTISNGKQVVVKYKDDEFYIKYVIYYTLDKRNYNPHYKRR